MHERAAIYHGRGEENASATIKAIETEENVTVGRIRGGKMFPGFGWIWIAFSLIQSCPVLEPGSFKTLRKTAATMMRAIGGVEVSELFLAHSEKSMAKFYSRPDSKATVAALATMRRKLAPMFNGWTTSHRDEFKTKANLKTIIHAK